jgi:acetyltransferase
LPPLNALLAEGLVGQAGIGPLLGAWRARPAADRPALIDTLLKVSRLACDFPDLAELDINPLLADASGVLALDARIRVHLPGAEHASLAILPYPESLEASVSVGGSPLCLRPIRPEDGERLRSFYAGASAQDLRLRFFMARREVPRSELARFSQIDYDREMTLVAVAPAAGQGGAERLVGEVRAACDPDNQVAEFGLLVAGDWQGRGLGRMLLSRLVDYLRMRGTRELRGQCRLENARMAQLARDLGFDVAPVAEGDALLDLSLRLQ